MPYLLGPGVMATNVMVASIFIRSRSQCLYQQTPLLLANSAATNDINPSDYSDHYIIDDTKYNSITSAPATILLVQLQAIYRYN